MVDFTFKPIDLSTGKFTGASIQIGLRQQEYSYDGVLEEGTLGLVNVDQDAAPAGRTMWAAVSLQYPKGPMGSWVSMLGWNPGSASVRGYEEAWRQALVPFQTFEDITEIAYLSVGLTPPRLVQDDTAEALERSRPSRLFATCTAAALLLAIGAAIFVARRRMATAQHKTATAKADAGSDML